jgi:hypothetical protein
MTGGMKTYEIAMKLKIKNRWVMHCLLAAITLSCAACCHAQTASTDSFNAKQLESQIKNVVHRVRPATVAILIPDMPGMGKLRASSFLKKFMF